MYDRGMWRLAPLSLAACAACHVVLGSYSVDEGGDGGAPAECRSDTDCDEDANEGCDNGRCALRCLDDSACPELSECWAARFCTEPIGSPCDLDDPNSCGGYLCRDVDAEAQPVAPYCPGHCNPPSVACPSGFTCLQLSCYRSP